MTDTEKLQKIRELLAPEPARTPLPMSVEDDLRALAADWLESDAHSVYGQAILDVLDNRK